MLRDVQKNPRPTSCVMEISVNVDVHDQIKTKQIRLSWKGG